eukprot:752695-Hanusia_phi.AAC.2
MGEVKVKVVDTRGSQLAGVMLSLTGENEYRQNNRTGDDGSFHFVGLLPGNYFLRPMLKVLFSFRQHWPRHDCTLQEYQFKPASQSVKIQEGENPTVQVDQVARGMPTLKRYLRSKESELPSAPSEQSAFSMGCTRRSERRTELLSCPTDCSRAVRSSKLRRWMRARGEEEEEEEDCGGLM